MLSFSNIAEVGDLIKAYDVPPLEGMPERFIAGIVVGKGRVFHVYDNDRKLFMGEGYTVDIVGGDTKSKARGRVGTSTFVPFVISMADHDGRVQRVMTAEELKQCTELCREGYLDATSTNKENHGNRN